MKIIMVIFLTLFFASSSFAGEISPSFVSAFEVSYMEFADCGDECLAVRAGIGRDNKDYVILVFFIAAIPCILFLPF